MYAKYFCLGFSLTENFQLEQLFVECAIIDAHIF